MLLSLAIGQCFGAKPPIRVYNTALTSCLLQVMKEGENFFERQEQFGRVYEDGDFFTFQCQMLKPETIVSVGRAGRGCVPGAAGVCLKALGACAGSSGAVSRMAERWSSRMRLTVTAMLVLV